MTKTIRPYQIQEAAERAFGTRLKVLEQRIVFLLDRINQLERRIGQAATVAETPEFEEIKNNVLFGGTANASNSERKENS